MKVTTTDEFRRIASLARRDPAELLTDAVAQAVTQALRLPGGTRELFQIQAAALVAACRSVELGSPGAFLPIGVGEGKTDITFALPYVLDAHRAVLLVPGALTTSKATRVGKTERDFAALRGQWKERPYGQILSYQKLGRANGIEILLRYRPDVIVCDEAHFLRNQEGAACARVVIEYITAARKAGHRVLLVVLSGTMTGGKLEHMSHLQSLALGARAFLPDDALDLDMWRRAVDAEVEAGGRVEPGCLLEFCHTDDLKGSQLSRARRAIRRRMHETEGVIASTTHRVRASLQFSAIAVPRIVPEETWYDLRKEWLLPNGDRCLDGLEVHRRAREYACGYVSEQVPPPPRPWYQARKAWAQEVYEAVVKDRACNTEVEARALLDSAAWHEWRDIRSSYDWEKNRVARWLSTATLDACATWAKRVKSGIIWTQHVPFGDRLARDYGIPYYREQGLNAAGEYLEQGRGVVCASVQANATGRNLQSIWSNNLIVSPFGSAEQNEQMLGRTHRTGQLADEVNAEFLVGCLEHINALGRAHDRAEAIELLTNNPQKLCYGTWIVVPETLRGDTGSQWRSHIDDDEDDALTEAGGDFLAGLFDETEDNEDEVIL